MSKLHSLEDLRQRISNLQQSPHENLGRWTTAQILYHLAGAFEGSVEGLPSGYSSLMRTILRPFRRVVTHFRFPPWLPIPKAIQHKLEPPPDVIFQEQVERLLAAIDRFEAFTGELAPHPVLGKLTRNEWIGFHLQHCRHHFSFVKDQQPN